MTIDEIQSEIIDEFSIFDDWMDKYNYLIEMSDSLPMIDEKLKNPDHLIDSCQSRVWIDVSVGEDGKLVLTGDSDAILVKGLVALVIRVFNHQTAKDIATAELYFIDKIGMKENLSPTRANGLFSMIRYIKRKAVELS